jgi:hypothetical protein
MHTTKRKEKKKKKEKRKKKRKNLAEYSEAVGTTTSDGHTRLQQKVLHK